MSEHCIVVGNDLLVPKYIAEDDIPRNSGRWPEYASTMLICIDSFENGLACGRLHNFYFEETASFASLDQLLFALETVMERAQMPQAAMEVRKPAPLKKTRKRKRVTAEEPMEDTAFMKKAPFYTPASMTAVRGKLDSFYIRVYARQHASMQGVLIHAESDETYAFRSEHELIRFLRDLLIERLSD